MVWLLDDQGPVQGVWQSHRVHGESRRGADGVSKRTFSHTALPPRDTGIPSGHQRGIGSHSHAERCVVFV